MDEGLDGGFVEVAEVGGGLPWFLAEHEELGGDEPECVNHDFAFDGLNGVDDHRDGTRSQLLKRLLCVDIHAREPTAKARVRVVPADDDFGAVREGGLVGICGGGTGFVWGRSTGRFVGACPSFSAERQDQRLRQRHRFRFGA